MQLPDGLRLITASEVGVGNFVPLLSAHTAGALVGDLRIRMLTNTSTPPLREAILHSSASGDWPDPRPHHFVVWADVMVRGRGPGSRPHVTIEKLVAGVVPKDLSGVNGLFVLDLTGNTYEVSGETRTIPHFPHDWYSALCRDVTDKVAELAMKA